MRRPRHASDSAISEVVGIVLMIALASLMAGILYFSADIGDSDGGAAPIEMTLVEGDDIRGNTKVLIVGSVSPGVNWSDVRVELNGRRLTYDAELAGDKTFCVGVATDVCTITNSWKPERTLVTGGQTLRVHASGLDGQTLRIMHVKTSTVVLSLALVDSPIDVRPEA